MNLYKLHTEQLLLNIQEFIPDDNPVLHSNSYNYLLKEMNEFENSGLTQHEHEIEKLVDKIKTTETTMECISLVVQFLKSFEKT